MESAKSQKHRSKKTKILFTLVIIASMMISCAGQACDYTDRDYPADPTKTESWAEGILLWLMDTMNCITIQFISYMEDYLLLQPDLNPFKPIINDLLQVLLPLYIFAIAFTGVYIIFLSTTPHNRAKAKTMLSRLLLGMALVTISFPIYELLVNLAGSITAKILAGWFYVGGGGGSGLFLSLTTLLGLGAGLIIYGPFSITIIPNLILLSLLSIMVRYFLVCFLAAIFPLTIFFYFFELTRKAGQTLMRYTIIAIFSQPAQALMLIIMINALNTAASGSATQSLISIMIATVGFLLFIFVPLAMLKILGWVGGAVAGLGIVLSARNPRLGATMMVGGGVAAGLGLEAVASGGAIYAIGKAYQKHMGPPPSTRYSRAMNRAKSKAHSITGKVAHKAKATTAKVIRPPRAGTKLGKAYSKVQKAGRPLLRTGKAAVHPIKTIKKNYISIGKTLFRPGYWLYAGTNKFAAIKRIPKYGLSIQKTSRWKPSSYGISITRHVGWNTYNKRIENVQNAKSVNEVLKQIKKNGTLKQSQINNIEKLWKNTIGQKHIPASEIKNIEKDLRLAGIDAKDIRQISSKWNSVKVGDRVLFGDARDIRGEFRKLNVSKDTLDRIDTRWSKLIRTPGLNPEHIGELKETLKEMGVKNNKITDIVERFHKTGDFDEIRKTAESTLTGKRREWQKSLQAISKDVNKLEKEIKELKYDQQLTGKKWTAEINSCYEKIETLNKEGIDIKQKLKTNSLKNIRSRVKSLDKYDVRELETIREAAADELKLTQFIRYDLHNANSFYEMDGLMGAEGFNKETLKIYQNLKEHHITKNYKNYMHSTVDNLRFKARAEIGEDLYKKGFRGMDLQRRREELLELRMPELSEKAKLMVDKGRVPNEKFINSLKRVIRTEKSKNLISIAENNDDVYTILKDERIPQEALAKYVHTPVPELDDLKEAAYKSIDDKIEFIKTKQLRPEHYARKAKKIGRYAIPGHAAHELIKEGPKELKKVRKWIVKKHPHTASIAESSAMAARVTLKGASVRTGSVLGRAGKSITSTGMYKKGARVGHKLSETRTYGAGKKIAGSNVAKNTYYITKKRRSLHELGQISYSDPERLVKIENALIHGGVDKREAHIFLQERLESSAAMSKTGFNKILADSNTLINAKKVLADTHYYKSVDKLYSIFKEKNTYAGQFNRLKKIVTRQGPLSGTANFNEILEDLQREDLTKIQKSVDKLGLDASGRNKLIDERMRITDEKRQSKARQIMLSKNSDKPKIPKKLGKDKVKSLRREYETKVLNGMDPQTAREELQIKINNEIIESGAFKEKYMKELMKYQVTAFEAENIYNFNVKDFRQDQLKKAGLQYADLSKLDSKQLKQLNEINGQATINAHHMQTKIIAKHSLAGIKNQHEIQKLYDTLSKDQEEFYDRTIGEFTKPHGHGGGHGGHGEHEHAGHDEHGHTDHEEHGHEEQKHTSHEEHGEHEEHGHTDHEEHGSAEHEEHGSDEHGEHDEHGGHDHYGPKMDPITQQFILAYDLGTNLHGKILFEDLLGIAPKPSHFYPGIGPDSLDEVKEDDTDKPQV